MSTTVGLLRFVSKYRFVTTSEQLDELVKLVGDNLEPLKRTITIVDCMLLYKKRNSKAVNAFNYLLQISRKLDMSILLVANADTKIDRRLEHQVSHTTRLLSTEMPCEEEVR